MTSGYYPRVGIARGERDWMERMSGMMLSGPAQKPRRRPVPLTYGSGALSL